MSRIAWTDQMSVGVGEVDRQHQKLLDLFNGLEEGLARGRASSVIRALFSELESYTKYHFATETNLMRLQGYQGLPDHVAAHDEFVARVGGLDPLLQRQGGDVAAVETSRFLRHWILRHIVVSDRLAFATMRRVAAQAFPGAGASAVDPE